MADYDAIVIGAGHNGLVAANVLAKGGAKVLRECGQGHTAPVCLAGLRR